MQFQHLNNIRKLILKSDILFEMLIMSLLPEMRWFSLVKHEKETIVYNTRIKTVIVDDFYHS